MDTKLRWNFPRAPQPHVPVKSWGYQTESAALSPGVSPLACGCPWAARGPCTTVRTFHGCTAGELCIYNTAEQKLNINSMKNRSSLLPTLTKGVTLGLGCLLYALKSPEWDEFHQTHLKSHKFWDTDFLRTPAPSDWCTDTVPLHLHPGPSSTKPCRPSLLEHPLQRTPTRLFVFIIFPAQGNSLTCVGSSDCWSSRKAQSSLLPFNI